MGIHVLGILLLPCWTATASVGYYLVGTEERSCGDASGYCRNGARYPTPFGFEAVNKGDGARAGYSDVVECRRGGWCRDGTWHGCAPGKFGAETRAVNDSVCQDCFPGYLCRGEGHFRGDPESCGGRGSCPQGSWAKIPLKKAHYLVYFGNRTLREAHDQKICEKGYYCSNDGVRHQCPAGRFGNETGLTDPGCSGPTEAGRYSPRAARTSADQGIECGGPDVFCPLGATSPKIVRPGWYSVGGSSETTRVAEQRSEPGGYAGNGIRSLCKNGTYTSEYGLSTQTECTPAPEGFYVPGPGFVKPIPCGGPSLLCPSSGLHSPVLVKQGYYTVNGTTTRRTDQKVAPPGFYATGGLLFPCPAGRYGAVAGLSDEACSGAARPGFWTPPGATSPTQRDCGGPDKICPEAAMVAPLNVAAGYYTTIAESPDDDFAILGEMCPPGTYNSNHNDTLFFDASHLYSDDDALTSLLSVCIRCPVGRFKAVPGDDPALCLKCDGTTSTDDRRTCDCLRAAGGAVLKSGEGLYFNASTGTCVVVARDIAEQNAKYLNETIFTRRRSYSCEAGYFCQGGLRRPCPRGRYGVALRETNANCTGECRAGYFCPLASTSPTARVCGHAGVYCGPGATDPRTVTPGYYTDPSVPAAVRSRELPCPAGFYCRGGVKFPCLPGRFGADSTNYSNDRCQGPCQSGYFCPEASTSPRMTPCGGHHVYCPPGSAEPSVVPDGYYSLHAQHLLTEDEYNDHGLGPDDDPTTMDAILPCEPGYWCRGGIMTKCPHFRYGWRTHQSSSDCDGGIAPGCYAPLSSDVYFTDCPVECGDNGHFCLGGEARPTAVTPGYYSIGVNATRRSGQLPCEPGTSCVNGVPRPCPAGKYHPTSAGTRCDFDCPPGHKCPVGTASPLPCDVGSYSFGRSADCIPCPHSRREDSSLQTCFHARRCCDF